MSVRIPSSPAPLEGDDVAPGYSGPTEVPWWRTNLPGPGGVGGSIGDLALYLAAHIHPEGPLRSAIELATEEHADAPSAMGLGWGHQGRGLFHDGGTGGFRSFIAFHRPTRTGVALLANSAQADVRDVSRIRGAHRHGPEPLSQSARRAV